MKTKQSLITAFLLFIAISLSAQHADKFTGSLLWKISGNGLKQPSYIVGTHHLMNGSFADSIPGLKDVIQQSNQMVGELLMSDMPALQAKIQAASLMPEGESYDKLLSANDYTKLDQELTAFFGMGLDKLGTLKPGIIGILYLITVTTKLYPDFNPAAHEAIDTYLQRIATESGKPVLGLETAEDQIYALFDAEPLKKQAEDIVCELGLSLDYNKEQLVLMTQYYREGKLKEMYDRSLNNPNAPCPSSEENKNIMLKDRNDKWLIQLPQLMKDKTNLIAVGALHLAGEEGLLFQLDKMGYKVEAVK